jgi:DNA-binding transcriptional LysR family regulator
MNIAQLQIFLTVVDCGSFSLAALELELSQSAVSRSIAALEDELGISLLTRGRFGAAVTPIGERLRPHAEAMVALREKIDQDISRERSLSSGCLRIASFRSAATHLVPPLIAQFRSRFPGVEVSLVEAEPAGVETLLREGRVDVGLVPLPRDGDGLYTWEMVHDEFVVLLPDRPGNRLWPEPLAWRDLAELAFILYNHAECTIAVRDHWQSCGQTLKIAYEIKEDSTIVSMVSQGLGAAVLPRLAALPIPAGIQVRTLPMPLERVIGIAIARDRLQSPAVFAFLNLVNCKLDCRLDCRPIRSGRGSANGGGG